MATEPTPPPAGGAGRPRGGMTLTSTWNGLPVWAWLGVGGLSAAGLYVFARRYRNAAAAAKAPASTTQGPTSDYPLVIPLPGPPGQSVKGDPGAPGAPGKDAPPPVPSPIPAPPPVQTPAPPPPPTPQPGPPPSTKYTVVPGDSLWRIASNFYGNGALWPQIYAANREAVGSNPNLIHPGLELTIP